MHHQFDTEIAKKYGINAAVLYTNFQYWVAKNKTNGHNYRDGRSWTYNSMRALVDLFPYLTDWDVRKALKTLIDSGVLLKANYNTKGYDRTTWYAFKDEKTALRGLPAHLWDSQMDDAKSTNGLCKIHKTIPTPTPYKNPNINKTKEVEISPQKRLDLDLLIATEKKFFMEQIALILKPNSREALTFSRIVKYLVEACQAGRLPISIFKDAIEWARQAKSSNARSKKALFVAKVKEQTGFKAQSKLLTKSG